jgi:dimethylargininase
MFTKAIVRKPCPEMIHGLSSSSPGKPDFDLALDPDSVFVEDVALCTPLCAIVTNPGAPSRNGEKQTILPVLKAYYDSVKSIESPGTLDAGDVMMVGSHFYIGISERTNSSGANQLKEILESEGMTASTVPLKEMLHLKSGLSYLEQNHLLISGEFLNRPAFAGFQLIEVDPDEAYAANSLWINSTVLVPSGFPNTLAKIKEAGYQTITLDVSEYRKLDGGLSCLSLRF